MPSVFKNLIYLFCFWILWYALTPWISREFEGYFILVHSCIIIFFGIYLLFRRNAYFSEIGWIPKAAFSLSYIFWGCSDLLWAVNYFIAGNGIKNSLAIAVSCFCSASYTSIGIGILASIRNSWVRFFDKRLLALSLIITTPVISTIAFVPYFQRREQTLFSWFNSGELAAISSGFILLNLVVFVLLSTQNLTWSIYSAGVLCILLGDFSIRAIKILQETINFDIYSVLCSFGIYASAFPFFHKKKIHKLDPVDFSSLFTTYKYGSLLIIFCCLMVFSFSQGANVYSLRMMTLCCSFASYFSIFLSYFLLQKIRSFATRMEKVIQGGLDQNNSVNFSDLPLELREQYQLAFEKTIEELKTKAKNQEMENTLQAQRQVAHDIRSPLAALNMIQEDFTLLPEGTRIILRSSIHRIQDIASILVNRGKSSFESKQVNLITSLLETIVSEKRIEYLSNPDISIETIFGEFSYGLFVKIDQSEFKRSVSNLLNNAIEAIGPVGNVQVKLEEKNEDITISIIDNGHGIPDSILCQLGRKGLSTKKSGQGLGVFYAQSVLEAWGGRIQFSQLTQGTEAQIILPKSPPPKWFIPAIRLSSNAVVIVLDDDPTIHQIWDRRLISKAKLIKHFYRCEDFLLWSFTQQFDDRFLFLVDYELIGSQKTGLDLIEEIEIEHQSILVTSHYDEEQIISRCVQNQIKMIPKNSAGIVPII